jgi:hypothetical protein
VADETTDTRDDFELVYVCNPELHGEKASDRPVPGRVTLQWLDAHADKGWVECDANGYIPAEIEGKTVPQLLELAQERGLTVPDKARKPELIKLLQEA